MRRSPAGTRARTTPACPVEAYARAVVAGELVAGRLVTLACRRHLQDLEQGPARGLRWDAAAAQRAIAFFGFLRLPLDGELDGKPFALEPSQAFIVGSLFGWKRADGYRRFRTAYVEQGKGNGKSPMAAGIGLYGLVADGEAAAEVYAAATKLDQARVLFRDAQRMVEASPSLRNRLDVGLANIAFLKTSSFFRPVSSEKRGLDGPRPHIGLIDELHEHPDAVVVDKIRAGTKSRRQALIFEITNSGYDRTTVCWAHHDYSRQVLEGHVQNDAWFAYVCQLDACDKCRAEGKDQPTEGCPTCDDWRDEKVWPKANPCLDTVITRQYLREQVTEAVGMPTKENVVKRLNFCIWTQASVHAIPMDKWDACALPAYEVLRERLRGRECYGGLDIGATSDFTAHVLLFPDADDEAVEIPIDPRKPDGEKWRVVRRSYDVLPFFWLPAEPVRRDPMMTAQIDVWRRQGLVRTTPGDVVDYDQVLADIKDLDRAYPLRKVAFDRGFQGSWIGTALLKEFGDKRVVSFAQGILSMAAPFRELVELLRLGRFRHGGHPVLRWMVSNCAAETRGGLVKPSKEKSREKIDGITGGTMALGVAMQGVGDEDWYRPGILTS